MRPDRRQFLKCSSYALALPFLPSFQKAANVKPSASAASAERLVCVGTQLGFYKPEFQAGRQGARLIRPLEEAGLDGHFTTFAGLDHQGPSGNAHGLVHTLYTGDVHPRVSLDQHVAPVIGAETRYESLQVSAGKSLDRGTFSFSDTGRPLVVNPDPRVLFTQVFGAGAVGQQEQEYQVAAGKSLLDDLRAEAGSFREHLGQTDRHRFDAYLESIRGVERKLERRREWLGRPYPEPPEGFSVPDDAGLDGSMLLVNEDLMWDLMALAVVNDSTRVLSLTIPITDRALLLDGELMGAGYHNISHHGHSPEKIEDLVTIEERHMRGAARFLKTLKSTEDSEGRSLLDSTVVLIGSAMGDAAAHRRRSFPLLLAGGGFRHRRHVQCGTVEVPNRMACDLFVSVLQRLGLEDTRFGTSESDLNGVLT